LSDFDILYNFNAKHPNMPVTVAARSKALVCGRLVAGIAGSNPDGGMDICQL
jgi:hypothetical protein